MVQVSEGFPTYSHFEKIVKETWRWLENCFEAYAIYMEADR